MFRCLACCLATICLVSWSQAPRPADTILVNGNVIGVDDVQPRAQAVAITHFLKSALNRRRRLVAIPVLLKALEYTLTGCPKKRDHLNDGGCAPVRQRRRRRGGGPYSAPPPRPRRVAGGGLRVVFGRGRVHGVDAARVAVGAAGDGAGVLRCALRHSAPKHTSRHPAACVFGLRFPDARSSDWNCTAPPSLPLGARPGWTTPCRRSA